MRKRNSIDKFIREVMARGCDRTLPENLNNAWLKELLIQANHMENCVENSSAGELLLAVIHIFSGKQSVAPKDMTNTEFLDYFQEYVLELKLEHFCREHGLRFDRPTLDTIFTDRNTYLNKMLYRSDNKLFICKRRVQKWI